VVGVDGSAQSKAALCWAARYAALAHTPLRVIAAWRLPTDYGWTVPVPEGWDPEADTARMLERALSEVLGSEVASGIAVSVVQGPPAKVLTEASESASLVVVGGRGRGGFTGTLLGSVSSFVAAHAHCPVVVVRASQGLLDPMAAMRQDGDGGHE
jgi:nucleotide-binding universal stress UspA family protein